MFPIARVVLAAYNYSLVLPGNGRGFMLGYSGRVLFYMAGLDMKSDFYTKLEIKIAHASNLLCFLARFSVCGALGRNMAGNTLKRGLKWYPAGLMG